MDGDLLGLLGGLLEGDLLGDLDFHGDLDELFNEDL
jgi:hypothetical protein